MQYIYSIAVSASHLSILHSKKYLAGSTRILNVTTDRYRYFWYLLENCLKKKTKKCSIRSVTQSDWALQRDLLGKLDKRIKVQTEILPILIRCDIAVLASHLSILTNFPRLDNRPYGCKTIFPCSRALTKLASQLAERVVPSARTHKRRHIRKQTKSKKERKKKKEERSEKSSENDTSILASKFFAWVMKAATSTAAFEVPALPAGGPICLWNFIHVSVTYA